MSTIDDDVSDDEVDSAIAAAGTRKQIRKEQRRVLFTSPGFIFGVLILGFWVLAALAPGLLTQWGPKDFVTNAAGDALVRDAPSSDAWFGTDRIGRDVYSRVIHGVRPILIVTPLAAGIAVAVGSLIGMTMGYYLGWVDEILSRIVEALLSIPAILLAIIVVFTFGASDPVIIGTVALLFTPPVARTVRAATIAESQLDYVTSAKMRGERSLFIITREIFPNISGLVVVELTVRFGYAIFTVATLSFLGITGGNQTDADWGVDVADNFEQIVSNIWWSTIFPALAIASLVIAVNLIADSIDKATSS
ncbi:MAG: ABC transporter permease [Acidimicrobiales bacterium]